MATTTPFSPGTSPGAVRQSALSLVRTGLIAAGRAVVVAGAAALHTILPVLVVAATGAMTVVLVNEYTVVSDGAPVGFVVALLVSGPVALWFARHYAGRTRGQLARWHGLRLKAAYSVRPPLEQDARGYWWTGYSYHRQQRVAKLVQFVHWAVRDQDTRNEALWLLVGPAAAAVLTLPLLALVVGGALLAVMAAVEAPRSGAGYLVDFMVWEAVALGAVVAGLLALPYAVRAFADFGHRILTRGLAQPTHAQLSRRVAELTVTRADAVDAQAAELRRIERDLHDGAQARLVAIGLTLGTIEHLLETDPAAARSLLSEARQSSAKALQELRDLVRGIHPPVLAERGLADAVRELALTSPLSTEVTVSLPSRPEAPVETAVYFSVSELLANAAKHSRAQHVWVDILFRAGRLRVSVTDDGHGGASFEGGGGLRGIERRLGTFDGVLSLSSPLGGPTTITMELPCALSSPRISTSSEKA
ncbi:sensor histidine kinase [Kitasatospora camelliae]|uniref:histidine kinase n=1 Tax=Kitasatospora camelliae TaxID=3156397 RepID=A0AAU8JX55_9ACTN